jgi:hypothetical protein
MPPRNTPAGGHHGRVNVRSVRRFDGFVVLFSQAQGASRKWCPLAFAAASKQLRAPSAGLRHLRRVGQLPTWRHYDLFIIDSLKEMIVPGAKKRI